MVCLDETSKQLIVETREPIPATPGQPERYDYEYQRNGTANLFMLFAPLEGWRHVEVTDCHVVQPGVFDGDKKGVAERRGQIDACDFHSQGWGGVGGFSCGRSSS